mmetsp:Transcript_2710/g.9183  ORF Transcript_2710/g.9183 Transcript_2710/m.9183 type:complete len:589 (+) Transcript_2710:99-1865(+)
MWAVPTKTPAPMKSGFSSRSASVASRRAPFPARVAMQPAAPAPRGLGAPLDPPRKGPITRRRLGVSRSSLAAGMEGMDGGRLECDPITYTVNMFTSDTITMEDGSAPEKLPEVEIVSADSIEEASEETKGGILEVAMLAIPALGAVLADPLMSLVDTACVGQVSSIQLAALGPNTALFNFFFHVFAFVGVATTSILASNSTEAPGITDEERNRRVVLRETMLSHALVVALVAGVSCMCGLLSFGPELLRIMGTPDEMMAPGLTYLYVRALAFPAMLFNIVCQGVCMGQQDSMSPLKIYGFASIFNVVFDMLLILKLGYGIAGAAWATTAGQYVGSILFLINMVRKGRDGSGIKLKFAGLPGMKDLGPFVDMAKTLVTRSLSLNTAYACLARNAALCGIVPLAAHQVTMQVFWLFSYVPEPLSMAVQSLIARDRTSKQRVHYLARTTMTVGLVAGFVLAAGVAAVLYGCPYIFTTDAAVVAVVHTLAPYAMLSVIICSLAMVGDGIGIGTQAFAHLAPSSVLCCIIVYLALMGVAYMGGGIVGVWATTVLFFGVRLLLHLIYFASKGEGNPLRKLRPDEMDGFTAVAMA